MTEDKKETQSSSPGHAKCFPPMRYMVASMTFLGFANIYAMRVNLSIAIAVMVANQTVIHHGMEVQVLYIFWKLTISKREVTETSGYLILYSEENTFHLLITKMFPSFL